MESIQNILHDFDITKNDLEEYSKLMNITIFKIIKNKGINLKDGVLAFDAACRRNTNLIKIFIANSIMAEVTKSMEIADTLFDAEENKEIIKQIKEQNIDTDTLNKAVEIMLKNDTNITIPKDPVEFLKQVKDGTLT